MAATRPATPAESAALTDLWDEFAADLRRFIARRVPRPDDAEDILQTVFLRMAASLHGLRDRGALVGWMYRLTRNAIVDHYRSAAHRRELAVAEPPDHPVEMDPDAEGAQARAELARCLRPMLGALAPEQADAVAMVDLAGMTHRDAARTAGVSVSGMKSRVQRGRTRLREQLLACCAVVQDTSGRVLDYQAAPGCGC